MTQTLKPCPFCANPLDIDDPDVIHPSGTGWCDHENGLRTYHSFREVERAYWCWQINCNTIYGGCGAQMHADGKDLVIEKWNRRAAP